MNPLNEVLTLSEAAHLWGVTPDSLRHRLNLGRFNPDEARKADSSKGEWLIRRSAMIRVYGPQKNI